MGAILFLLCTGRTLLDVNLDGTLEQRELLQLAQWSEGQAAALVSQIRNRYSLSPL